MRPAFATVVFDLDGTLIDSAPEIAGALNTVLAAHGRPGLPVDRVIGMIGDGSAMLLRRGFEATGAPAPDFDRALARFVEIYDAWPADPTQIYPGVPETLAALRAAGVRIGLCTNKPETVTRSVLAGLGLLSAFDAIAGGDTLPVRKPDPNHLAWVVDRLGGDRATSVMVGDNANDVAAARGYGAPVVAVAYGYPRMPLADLGADAIIDRMADLPAALTALAARRGRIAGG
jgi:phosphoglycolate phosphatase